MNSEELKPCPFCGGDNIRHEPGQFIACMNVNCGGQVDMGSPWGGPKADGVAFLVRAWNTRAALQPSPAVGGREVIARIAEAAGAIVYASSPRPWSWCRDRAGEIMDMANALLSPAIPQQDAEALEGYRAATHWIGADSWDGCSDCMDILRMATHADLGRDMTPDELAAALKRLRAHGAQFPDRPQREAANLAECVMCFGSGRSDYAEACPKCDGLGLTAVPAKPQPSDDWRDIGGAPQDGTPVMIGWFKDGVWTERRAWWDAKFDCDWPKGAEESIYRGAWTDDAVVSFSYERTAEYQPTHWRPVPDAPAINNSDRKETSDESS